MSNTTEILSYPIQVQPLPKRMGGGYEALFTPLSRGVVGYGKSPTDAVNQLVAAAPAFLEALDDLGRRLPLTDEQAESQRFSGKFNVRIPKALHATLARLASEQDVSLNSLVQALLISGATSLEAGHGFVSGAEGGFNKRPTLRADKRQPQGSPVSTLGAPKRRVIGLGEDD